MNKMSCDVVVVGGGMIGSTFALVLAQAGFLVQVIDHMQVSITDDTTIPDLRVSAISCDSVNLLQRIGVWQRIKSYFCVPYRRLETWEHPSSVLVFDASSLNLSELGFMVENKRLLLALWQTFTEYDDTLTLRCPSSLRAMVYDGNCWILTLDDGSVIKSRIVVGADGANSLVRQQAWIAVSGWQYCQSCLLLNVETENDQQDVTWQALHPSGPRAFLPLYGHWASLVWYDNPIRIRKLLDLPLSILEQKVLMAFPPRLGPITLHRAASFSLTCLHTHDYVKTGLALIGDAAHTINPLAGQGANLGFRDAQTLAEVLITARIRGELWDELVVLRRYQHRRLLYNLLMQIGIDMFYITFSNNHPLLKFTRNLGLVLMQNSGISKKLILRYALGL